MGAICGLSGEALEGEVRRDEGRGGTEEGSLEGG